MENNALSDVIQEIKTRLKDYIVNVRHKTMTSDGFFQCPVTYNHKHGDRTPSAHYDMKDGIGVWYCHTCGANGSIYDLLQYEEGMQVTGPGFLEATSYLAQKLDIFVEEKDIFGADYTQYCIEMSAVEIYKDIEDYLVEHGSPVEALMDPDFGRGYPRGIAENMASLVPMGSVDHDELFSFLEEKYGDKFRDTRLYKATKPGTVFGKNSLTISYRDQRGNPIRFIARYRNSYLDSITDETVKIRKYIQTVGLFGKVKEVPFLIDVASDEIKRTKKAIITEGEFGALALHVMDFPQAMASRGVSITNRFIDILCNFGVKDITLVLDNDKAGIGSVRKNYKVFVEGGMDVFVLPMEVDYDPDKYLREGMALDLSDRIDAVIYLLKNDPEFTDETISEMIRYKNCLTFVSENVMLNSYQQKYAYEIIGPMFHFDGEAVYTDIKNMVLGLETKDIRVKKIQDSVESMKDMPIMDRINVYEQGAEQLRNIISEKGQGLMMDTYNTFRAIKKSDVKFPKKIYVGNGDFDEFDSECSLLTSTISVWAGWPSNGKSATVRNIVMNILKNERNFKVVDDRNIKKPVIIHFSLDDDRKNTMLNYMSMITKQRTAKIRNMFESHHWGDSDLAHQYDAEIAEFFRNSIHVFGSEHCSDVTGIGRLMNITRSEYPDNPIIGVLDALNNLADFNKDNQIAAAEAVVRDVKRFSVRYDMHTAIVAHMKKHPGEDRRPRLSDLKGSSFIEHEPQNIFLMYMDYHYKKTASEMIWMMQDPDPESPTYGTDIYNPVIEVNIAKDKNHPAATIQPYNFNPVNLVMHAPRREEDIIRYEEALKKAR